MTKRLLLIFICFSVNIHAKYNCNDVIKSFVTRSESNSLRLISKYARKLDSLIKNSKNKKELSEFIDGIETSLSLKVGNVLKFRSSQIYDVLKLIDEKGVRTSYFIDRLLEGKSLTIKEKRAFYLLKNRRFWFKDGLYKNVVSDAYQKISIISLFQTNMYKLNKMAMNTQFDELLTQFNQARFLDKIFKNTQYEENINDIFSNLFKIDDKSNSTDVISVTKMKLQQEISKTRGINKKYLEFRYDQLLIIEDSLLNEKFSPEDFIIRHKNLFARIPNTLKSVESFTKIMLVVVQATIIIDYVFEKYLEGREVNELDIAKLIEISSAYEEIPQMSPEEALEERFNSGEITFEQYLESLEQLN